MLATLFVSFLMFAGSALALLACQRLRRAPLPVGCRPAGTDGGCAGAGDAAGGCACRGTRSIEA